MARTELGLALALFGAACTKDPVVVETPINFVLAAGDDEAETRLKKIEIEVWPSTAGACPVLSSWRRLVCGDECSDPPSPRDRGELPEATATLVRDAAGNWSPLRLSAPTQGP